MSKGKKKMGYEESFLNDYTRIPGIYIQVNIYSLST